MVEPRGSASKEGQQDALEGGSRHGGTDPESFTYGKKESRLEISVSGSVIWSAGQECGGMGIKNARAASSGSGS